MPLILALAKLNSNEIYNEIKLMFLISILRIMLQLFPSRLQELNQVHDSIIFLVLLGISNLGQKLGQL